MLQQLKSLASSGSVQECGLAHMWKVVAEHEKNSRDSVLLGRASVLSSM
jgi:hypothetical protein